MRKYLFLFVFMVSLLAMPITSFASENAGSVVPESMVLLGDGYTEEGVYYEVYGNPYEGNVNARIQLEVERTVVFVGDVFPPQTMEWREEIAGIQTSGTLHLVSFYYNASTHRTTAIYEGTLRG